MRMGVVPVRMIDLDKFVEPLLGVFRSFLLVEDLVWCGNGIHRCDIGPAKFFMMMVPAMTIAYHGVESTLLMLSGCIGSRVRCRRHRFRGRRMKRMETAT